MADITPAGGDPVDVRVVLRKDGRALSEVLVVQMVSG